jgi:hypothetical protein
MMFFKKKLDNMKMTQGNIYSQEYVSKIVTNGVVAEECLVDVWIGHNRFAFIDLTAGPFHWGPSIAGEGARTIHSLPIVPNKKQRLRNKGY